MKNNKKGLAKKKTDRNTMLNEVGGAVDLQWKKENDIWTATSIFNFVTYEIHRSHQFYQLQVIGMQRNIIACFNKLASAKKVAEFVDNG
jgi:hypothetical protein